MKRRISHCLAIAAVLLTAVPLVAAESDWLLRLAVEEGETQRFVMSQTQNMDVDMGGMGRQEVRNSSRTEFLQTVKEQLPDGAFVIDVAFGAMRAEMNFGGMSMEFDSEDPGDPSHPMAKLQKLMKGQQFSVTMTPLGQVRSIDGLDAVFDAMSETLADQPETRKTMESLIPAFKSASVEALMQYGVLLYPEQAVGVGDSWQQQLNVTNPALGILSITNDYTIEGAERVKERDCVRIGVSSTIEFEGEVPAIAQMGQMLGGDFSLEVGDASGKGTVWIDVAQGWVVESKSEQTINMNMSITVPPSGEGTEGQTVEMHTRVMQEIEVELLD